jgi:hypothetical protein
MMETNVTSLTSYNLNKRTLKTVHNVKHKHFIMDYATDRMNEIFGLNSRQAQRMSSSQRKDGIKDPLSLLFKGCHGLFPGGETWAGYEADHSNSSCIEIKKA